MEILFADDAPVASLLLETVLKREGYDVVATRSGTAMLEKLQSTSPSEIPDVIILDWMMPGLDGVEVCRTLRSTPAYDLSYVLLLTSRSNAADLAFALDAGANDYVTKPFNATELVARVRVAQRVVALQKSLAARVSQLQQALAQVHQLQGLLPICAWCKKVRNEEEYWEQLDSYLASHSHVELTHGICPDCLEKMMPVSKAGAGLLA